MSNSVPDHIIEKLQKLMAMKERPGSEGEAANAAMLIQNICTKYNVDLNILERPEEQTAESKELEFTQRMQPYDLTIAHAVDQICDVRHFLAVRRERKYFKDRKGRPDFKIVTAKCIVFVGLRANVETAALVWQYLDRAIYNMLDSRFKRGHVKGLAEHRAYRMGAAQRVLELCRQQKEEYLDRIEGDQTKAVILMGNSVAETALENMKKSGSLKGTYSSNNDVGRSYGAYSMGHQDGAEIDPHGARTSKMLE